MAERVTVGLGLGLWWRSQSWGQEDTASSNTGTQGPTRTSCGEAPAGPPGSSLESESGALFHGGGAKTEHRDRGTGNCEMGVKEVARKEESSGGHRSLVSPMGRAQKRAGAPPGRTRSEEPGQAAGCGAGAGGPTVPADLQSC